MVPKELSMKEYYSLAMTNSSTNYGLHNTPLPFQDWVPLPFIPLVQAFIHLSHLYSGRSEVVVFFIRF